jgi:hypothetical protein
MQKLANIAVNIFVGLVLVTAIYMLVMSILVWASGGVTEQITVR